MFASFINSPRKIRVGYHWKNAEGQARVDRISYYVNNITQTANNSNVGIR